MTDRIAPSLVRREHRNLIANGPPWARFCKPEVAGSHLWAGSCVGWAGSCVDSKRQM